MRNEEEKEFSRVFNFVLLTCISVPLMILMALGAGACSVTNLKKCDLVLSKTPPGGRLICDEREIPVDVVAPWIRKCAEDRLKENNR